MRFVLMTIFPEFFETPLQAGLLGKALEKGILNVERVNLRDYTHDRHNTVDDTPYGGGPGMVMKIEPLAEALDDVKKKWPIRKTVLLSPRGRTFNQKIASEIVGWEEVCFICGRYEGVDERLVEGGFVDEELSIGDFVLNGGETAALAVLETCSRLLPGMVGNALSVEYDSYTSGILDYPHYTKPREFRGLGVPDVLLSGDHAKIDLWRRKTALRAKRDRRPDLLEESKLSKADQKLLRS